MAKKTGKNRSLIRIFILVVNVFFALLLVLALLSTRISPERNYIPSFLGLAYPVLFYINLLFVLIWLLIRKRMAIISFVALLSGFSLFPRYFQFNASRTKSPKDTETFTIVSYNIQSFRTFYNHESLAYLDSLKEFLSALNPDILCFQEYYNDLEMEDDITSQMMTTLELEHSYINSRLTRFDRYQFGLAVFSKFPIIASGRLLNANYKNELYTTNYATFSDLLIYGDTFRLYNVHLESMKISEDDDFLESLDEGSHLEITKESRILFSKLKDAFVFRANQIKPIREHMNSSPYPVILCGDFNDTPASWAYQQMSEGLQDAFMKAGRGTGKTYNGKYPSFRIDYILTAPSLKIHWFETRYSEFSDHFPVIAVCSVKK
jgi:endonuclease/exonuclease/phosphatase family metal-dependent hydrolase